MYFPTSAMVTSSNDRSCLVIVRVWQNTKPDANLPASKFFPAAFQMMTSVGHLLGQLKASKVQPFLQELDDALRLKEKGDMVDGGDVMHADNLFRRDVTEH